MAFDERQLQDMRERLPEYLEAAHRIDTRRAFRCLHPDHDDKHPSMRYDGKRSRVKCFSCGESGDVFDVAGWDARTDDFKKQVRHAAEVLGASVDDGKPLPYWPKHRHGGPRWGEPQPVEGEDVLAAVQDASFALFDDPAAKPALHHFRWRGFTDEEIMRNGWGWVPHPSAMFDQGFDKAPRVTQGYLCMPFPEDEEWSAVRYCAFRECRNDAMAKEWCAKGKPSPIWREHLLSQPGTVYVTEGVFDAAAIMSMRPGSKACAICGESGIRRLLAIMENEAAERRPLLEIAMDDDKAGRRMAERLAGGLRGMGAQFRTISGFGGLKDPCEMLSAYRKGVR